MYHRIDKSRCYKSSRFFRDTYFLEIGIIQVFSNFTAFLARWTAAACPLFYNIFKDTNQ
jgi:hypothetical protein